MINIALNASKWTSTGSADHSLEPLPKVGRIPGNGAVWVGIYAEMTEFALMFIICLVAKAHYSEVFKEGPAQLFPCLRVKPSMSETGISVPVLTQVASFLP